MDKNYGYKHTKGFFVFFFVVFLMGLVAVYAQTSTIDTTGNLVNNTQTPTNSTGTWQNAVFQNSLTCWAAGDPGYCGPNPIVRPSGDINFSYGMVDLHQRVNVGKALPYGGTGLVTTGFNFSWTSKNGNGWDDGKQDTLSAYVKLYNSGDSKVIESFNYNLNFLHDWTSYNWSANWVNTKIGYRENQVGNVQFGFVGKDNNYWAGPYGPEVNNVNFQLKYKPDPCKNNPLFSPECPNFTQELAKNNTAPTIDTKFSGAPTNNTEFLPPPPPPKENKDGVEDGRHEDDRYEEGYVEVNIDRLVDTLIKIQDNQSREEKITMQASEKAVKETNQTAQQTVKQAEKVAEKFTKESIEIGLVSQQVIVDTKDNRASQSLALFQAPATLSTDSFKLPGAQQQNLTIHLQNQSVQQQNSTTTQQEQGYKPPTQSNIFSLALNYTQPENTSQPLNSTSTTSLFQLQTNSSNQTNSTTLALLNPLANQITETPSLANNFLTNRTNPINSIIEDKPQKPELESKQTQTQQVKSNVQDNDAAAGVSIASIARTPVGFNTYMIALTDASFYAPKEIYRNQKTIDNTRALRQLASDRLHQQMVDQQYLPR